MSGNDGGRRGGNDRPDRSSDGKKALQRKDRLPKDAEKLGYGANARMPEEEAPGNYGSSED